MSYLLSLGSVVKLKKTSVSKIMILGYGIENRITGQTYQYAGVLIPEGIPETNSFFLFNHDDIQEIVFEKT